VAGHRAEKAARIFIELAGAVPMLFPAERAVAESPEAFEPRLHQFDLDLDLITH
jgi:hypothetical protein